MDERMKEIEERWPFLFPLDRSKGELVDAIVASNKDIFYLTKQVEELEHDLSLNASLLARQTDMAREAEIRVMELEEAIRKQRNKKEGYAEPEDEELYKILEEK